MFVCVIQKKMRKKGNWQVNFKRFAFDMFAERKGCIFFLRVERGIFEEKKLVSSIHFFTEMSLIDFCTENVAYKF